MAEVAVLTKWGDEFYFVSDDGEAFYEVTQPPRADADLDPIRPLGVRDNLLLISFARRWFHATAHDPSQQPASVRFYTV